MIGLVLVTHGRLAAEFLAAMEHVVGPQQQTQAVCIDADDDIEQRRSEIVEAIREVDDGSGVVVLTDMFGGTPSNLAMTFLETNRLEVITGVNLPMLIKLASLRTSHDLLAVAREMRDHGRMAIWVASDLLRGEKAG